MNDAQEQDKPQPFKLPIEFGLFALFVLMLMTVVGIWILQMAWAPV